MSEKTFLITEAQRDIVMSVTAAFSSKATELLQSLPMVDSEPTAWILEFTNDYGASRRDFFYAKNHLERHVEHNKGMGYVCEVTPLYTSPQALTQISADDVTDEMINDCLPHWMMSSISDVRDIFTRPTSRGKHEI